MYGAVKGRLEDQDARKIIAQHLVKDYILKEKIKACIRKRADYSAVSKKESSMR